MMGAQETKPAPCSKCGRTSYSWRIWQWCPWCDSARKPGPSRQRYADMVMG